MKYLSARDFVVEGLKSLSASLRGLSRNKKALVLSDVLLEDSCDALRNLPEGTRVFLEFRHGERLLKRTEITLVPSTQASWKFEGIVEL